MDTAAGNIIETIRQIVVWLALFVLVVLLYRQGFEQLISKPIIEKLAGAKGHQTLQKIGDILKAGQPYLVLAVGLALSFALPLDLVTALNAIVKLFPDGALDSQTLNIVNGVISAIGAMTAHGLIRFRAGPAALLMSR
jgi:hypothetical protein